MIGEVLFSELEEWGRFAGLLNTMVVNHLGIHGAMTQKEFHHIVSASTLCYGTLTSGGSGDRTDPTTGTRAPTPVTWRTLYSINGANREIVWRRNLR